MDSLIYIAPLFFLTALIYSSVGFGGGSTYLALLVLFSFPYEEIPKTALILNLVVVSGGLYHYISNQHLSFKRTLPFIVTSVPLAYLGGRIPVNQNVFLGLLGFALTVAGLRLLFFFNGKTDAHDGQTPAKGGQALFAPTGLMIGVPLGFLSGLTGIGGGIFLAPLLYFLRWGNGQTIAATCCFFIFVNSLSGLIGQWGKAGTYGSIPLLLILAVFLGGQIGSRLSVGKWSLVTLQRTTAILILIVSLKIFWGMMS